MTDELPQFTSEQALKPLLAIIFDSLKERGWKLAGNGRYEDPEGNVWNTLEGAISAQTMREIAGPLPQLETTDRPIGDEG